LKKGLAFLLFFWALAFGQDPPPGDDPQSLAAVRNAVTRLNTQLLLLQQQLSALTDSTSANFTALQASLVPVGAVIDWYRPRPTTPVPLGFLICNGATVADPQSELNGTNVPDLTDKFVMGVTPGRLGEKGGRTDIPADGAHAHGGVTAGFGGYQPGEINYDRGPGKQDQFEMRFKIASDGTHAHGGENRPPYYGLIKLIRIK
jgi:hypothetical protein